MLSAYSFAVSAGGQVFGMHHFSKRAVMQFFFRPPKRGSYSLVAHAGTIGLHLVSGTAVGAFLGWLLDGWLGTSPWFSIILLVAGIIAGFKNVYTDTKRLLRMQEELDNDKDGQLPPEN